MPNGHLGFADTNGTYTRECQGQQSQLSASHYGQLTASQLSTWVLGMHLIDCLLPSRPSPDIYLAYNIITPMHIYFTNQVEKCSTTS